MANDYSPSLPFQPAANAGSGQGSGIDLGAILNFLKTQVLPSQWNPDNYKTGDYKMPQSHFSQTAPTTPLPKAPGMSPQPKPMQGAGLPKFPPSPFKQSAQARMAPVDKGGMGNSPLASAIAQSPMQGPQEDAGPQQPSSAPPQGEIADPSIAPDDSLLTARTPALPTTQSSSYLMANNPQGLAPGLQAGLSGQPGLGSAPGGNGDLMSLISRLLHMHGH